MGCWRSRLAQEAYTFKVGGSSPSHPTNKYRGGGAMVARKAHNLETQFESDVRNKFIWGLLVLTVMLSIKIMSS